MWEDEDYMTGAEEDKTKWFINKNVILGIPDSEINSEETELIRECISFLDEFIELSNQSIIPPFLAISTMVIILSVLTEETEPELTVIDKHLLVDMCKRYEKTIFDKFEKTAGGVLFKAFLDSLGGE